MSEKTHHSFESPSGPGQSPRQELWEHFRENRMAGAGLVIFLLFFLISVLGLLLTSGQHPVWDPSRIRLQEKLRPPLSEANNQVLTQEEMPPFGMYLLGTDNLGRDVFARMLQGAWVSLSVGFVAVGISLVVGIVLGGIAGYYGERRIRLGTLLAWGLLLGGVFLAAGERLSWALALGGAGLLLALAILFRKSFLPRPLVHPVLFVDTLVMRLVDIMLCFPSFFLILTVVALLPASLYNIMAVIGLTSWMGAARFVRAEFLSLREQDFVTAARALGVRNVRIIFRHMLPNAMGPVLVSATLGIAGAILTEAGLSFLGFGVPPPHATWGNILSDGKDYIFDAPWLTFAPGMAILVVVLSFNLFGEGLRDLLNPRLRERL